MKQEMWVRVTLRDERRKVRVEVERGDPGCRTMRNGDPGWPPTPDDVEVMEVDGIEVEDLTQEELDKIDEQVWEEVEWEEHDREAFEPEED